MSLYCWCFLHVFSIIFLVWGFDFSPSVFLILFFMLFQIRGSKLHGKFRYYSSWKLLISTVNIFLMLHCSFLYSFSWIIMDTQLNVLSYNTAWLQRDAYTLVCKENYSYKFSMFMLIWCFLLVLNIFNMF